MRRRGFLMTLLLAFCLAFFLFLAAGPRGAGERALPTLAEAAELSDRDALEALSGFRRGEILAAWGEPHHSSDHFYRSFTDWFDVPGGFVAVDYDAEGLASDEPLGPDSPDIDTLPVRHVNTLKGRGTL